MCLSIFVLLFLLPIRSVCSLSLSHLILLCDELTGEKLWIMVPDNNQSNIGKKSNFILWESFTIEHVLWGRLNIFLAWTHQYFKDSLLILNRSTENHCIGDTTRQPHLCHVVMLLFSVLLFSYYPWSFHIARQVSLSSHMTPTLRLSFLPTSH